MRTFTEEEDQRFLASIDRRAASAAAWLETPEGKLVIVRSDYKLHWSLPGGLVDAGENPLEAVQREVAEEIGIWLPAEAFMFRLVVSRTSSPPLKFSYQFLFQASVSDEQLASIKLQAGEIEELAVVSRDEIQRGERVYAPAIYAWASGEAGYAEHQLER